MAQETKYGLSLMIGETLSGLPYPIFYDPHFPIRIKKPPVTSITGSPGSGKTFLGMLIAAQASLLGKTGVILDPKGDFSALANLKKANYIDNVHIWSLVSKGGEIDEENSGMLDPTLFYSSPNDNTALTKDVIKILCNGEITHTQETALTPIINDVTYSPNPSFERVVSKLLSNRNDEIRSLGYTLETLLKTKLAKLLVVNKRIKRKELTLNKEMLVVNLQGIELPADTKLSKDYSSQEKISIIILSLLSQIVLEMMRNMDEEIYKLLLIDEAWSIISTSIGDNMIKEAARLGRSKNLATILMTQSSKHLGGEEETDLNTMISVRFAFRNNDDIDNQATVHLMRLPDSEGWDTTITTLDTGECLFQNAEQEASFIHIMAPDKWVDMFNTTPITDDK